MKRLISVVMLLLLSGCGGSDSWSPPAQKWEDVTVRIESRPAPVQAGMNEFLVIANHQQRGFMSDMVVHIRTDGSEWRQAIPDGALGVFRRALPVRDPATEMLHVQLKRQGKTGELLFRLAPDATAAH